MLPSPDQLVHIASSRWRPGRHGTGGLLSTIGRAGRVKPSSECSQPFCLNSGRLCRLGNMHHPSVIAPSSLTHAWHSSPTCSKCFLQLHELLRQCFLTRFSKEVNVWGIFDHDVLLECILYIICSLHHHLQSDTNLWKSCMLGSCFVVMICGACAEEE